MSYVPVHDRRRQRRLAELTAKIDVLVVFDEAWLARNGRRHRLREAYWCEIERQELATGRPMTLDEDCSRWLTIVRDYGNGIRGCAFMMDCACEAMTDPGEAIVGALYERLIGGAA